MLHTSRGLFSLSFAKTAVIIFYYEMHKNDFEHYMEIVSFYEKELARVTLLLKHPF